MTELQVPELMNCYLLFCNYRDAALKSNILDLQWCRWMYPTTLLPLGVFIKKHKTTIEYLPPHDQNVSNYIDLVTGTITFEEVDNKSYIPFVFLPTDRKKSVSILERIFKLHNNGKEYGGENAFKYLISELVDNIYEHSKFTNAIVMAQRYEKKKCVEICFYDDGVSIPGSFESKSMLFEDHEAIVKAINGLSTKSKERGYGLSSNIRIFTEGLLGEIFIASRNGAIYIAKNRQKVYKLSDKHTLEGTLVSIKIPYPSREVDIYEFLN